MVTRVPVAFAEDTAEHTRSALNGGHFDCVDLICVLDPAGRLEGVVPLAVLCGCAIGTLTARTTRLRILSSVTPRIPSPNLSPASGGEER